MKFEIFHTDVFLNIALLYKTRNNSLVLAKMAFFEEKNQIEILYNFRKIKYIYFLKQCTQVLFYIRRKNIRALFKNYIV